MIVHAIGPSLLNAGGQGIAAQSNKLAYLVADNSKENFLEGRDQGRMFYELQNSLFSLFVVCDEEAPDVPVPATIITSH